jgi:hypothetical protein
MCCGRVRPISITRRLDPPTKGGLEFTYTGRTWLTVRGPGTGIVYRFPRAGASLRVDRRDAEALKRVPVLRADG